MQTRMHASKLKEYQRRSSQVH